MDIIVKTNANPTQDVGVVHELEQSAAQNACIQSRLYRILEGMSDLQLCGETALGIIRACNKMQENQIRTIKLLRELRDREQPQPAVPEHPPASAEPVQPEIVTSTQAEQDGASSNSPQIQHQAAPEPQHEAAPQPALLLLPIPAPLPVLQPAMRLPHGLANALMQSMGRPLANHRAEMPLQQPTPRWLDGLQTHPNPSRHLPRPEPSQADFVSLPGKPSNRSPPRPPPRAPRPGGPCAVASRAGSLPASGSPSLPRHIDPTSARDR